LCDGCIESDFYSEFVQPSDFLFTCHNCDIKFIDCQDFNAHSRNKHGIVNPILENVKQGHGKPGQCPICGKVYGSRSMLQHHIVLHTNKEAYQCDICHKNLQSPHSLKYHKKIHSGSSHPSFLYKNHHDSICELCGRVFPFKGDLKKHMKKSHKDRDPTSDEKFSCSKCSKTFDSLAGRNNHYSKCQEERMELNEHNGLKNHKFNKRIFVKKKICGTARYYNYRYKYHKRPPTVKCQICPRMFHSQSQLKDHLNTHKGIKPYKCIYCYKCFASKNQQVNHQKIHGEKKFSCDICSRKFIRKANMLIHYRTHTGERPFPCKVCGFRFRQQGDMNKHLQRHFKENSHSEKEKAK